jgi:tetratricopeptide (TPR) repeat protein
LFATSKKNPKTLNKNCQTIFCSLFLFCLTSIAEANLSNEQVYSLFGQANQSFRQANSTDDSDQAQKLYEKAILNYEKIISDGQIQNSKLYYNLANAYFLSGNLGKAILNYRRAEKLDGSDTNIQKNLAFARSKRIDKIPMKTEKRVLHTLFFWHYDFSIKTKFILTCLFFTVVCILLTVMIWFGKTAGRITTVVIFSILFICFLASAVLETQIQANRICGVITNQQVIARQGDGQNYPESFKEPLHVGTEFDLLERRAGWFHIKLSDDSDTWIPDNSAELI